MRSHTLGLGLALFVSAGLAALPAQAQSLTLGAYGSSTSGKATLTNSGTAVSGDYTFDPAGSPAPLSQQTTFDNWTLYGPSTADISGGTINEFSLLGPGTARVSGGYFQELDVSGLGTLNITGGTFSNGAASAALYNEDGGTINLFGSGFTKHYFFGSSAHLVYFVSGTLSDGTELNSEYYVRYHSVTDSDGISHIVEDGRLNFLPVPEASSVVSLGLLLGLGLAAAAFSARRRKSLAAGTPYFVRIK